MIRHCMTSDFFLKKNIDLSFDKKKDIFTTFLAAALLRQPLPLSTKGIIPHFWTFGVTRIRNCVVAGVTRIWQRMMTMRKKKKTTQKTTRTKAALS